jgi:short-subunit dehydrogenase
MASLFSGKVVFLTGASSGIGAALALELAKRGAILALAARRTDLLEKVKSDCENLGAKVSLHQCDVVQATEVAIVVDTIKNMFGPIDVVIANAGVSGGFKASRFPVDVAGQIIDVNVKGLLNTIGSVLPDMCHRERGVIVGISSLASYISFPQSYVYCASKSAVSAILLGLRRELRNTNIQVTTICPGYIRTDMTASNQFSMPFLMDVDVAARRIVAAIERGDAVYNFPRRLRWLIRILSVLPEGLLLLPFKGGRSIKKSG